MQRRPWHSGLAQSNAANVSFPKYFFFFANINRGMPSIMLAGIFEHLQHLKRSLAQLYTRRWLHHPLRNPVFGFGRGLCGRLWRGRLES